jgi:hypothetical protein
MMPFGRREPTASGHRTNKESPYPGYAGGIQAPEKTENVTGMRGREQPSSDFKSG